MISMLERNVQIKERPERFQDTKEKFDVIITCESRVFEQVNQGRLACHASDSHTALLEDGAQLNQPVHVVNFEIKDTPESATIGALWIQDFCELVCSFSSPTPLHV